MDDIHKALLADLTDGPEQNWLSGLSVAVNIGSNVLLLVLGYFLWRDEVPDSAFLVTGLLVAVGVLWTVAGLREPPPAVWSSGRDREDAARLPPLELIRRYRGALIFCPGDLLLLVRRERSPAAGLDLHPRHPRCQRRRGPAPARPADAEHQPASPADGRAR